MHAGADCFLCPRRPSPLGLPKSWTSRPQWSLVDKGVRPGDEVAGILRTLTGQHQEWMAERLLEHGMPVEPNNYDALYACVSNQAVGAAKLLLDRGIDLEQYQLWAEHRPKGDGYAETMEELAAYWSELQNSTQPEDSPMKGMNL